MRSEVEITKAHDLLTQIVSDRFPEVATGLDQETREAVDRVKDALCWVLEHESNFAHNLDCLVNLVQGLGYGANDEGGELEEDSELLAEEQYDEFCRKDPALQKCSAMYQVLTPD